jgi:hypothetical protein
MKLRTYTHAKPEQLLNSMLKHHGMAQPEQVKPQNTPRHCTVCNKLNEGIAEFCDRCGHALTLKTAITSEQLFKKELKETMSKFMDMVKDKEKFCRIPKISGSE